MNVRFRHFMGALAVLSVVAMLSACTAPQETLEPQPTDAGGDNVADTGGDMGGADNANTNDNVSGTDVGGGESGQPVEPGGVRLAMADVPRQTTPAADPTAVAAVSQGNTQFALDLYHAARPAQTGNFIYSPYSISLAFAMLFGGARGETERQIAETLNYPLPQDQLHPAFNALDLQLRGISDQSPEEVTLEPEMSTPLRLNIANSMWGQQDFHFEDSYLTLLAEHYGAGLRLVDFINQTEPSREAINQWVSDETEERIQNLIPQGAITQDTRLVLANAIYFYGGWMFPFDEGGTQDGPFTLLDGSQVTVPMMTQYGPGAGYASGDGWQAVSLPYGSGEAAMLIILPDAGRFEEVEGSLDAAKFEEIRTGLGYPEISLLKMPRWDFETMLDLTSILKGMGMQIPFEDSADLSGITGEPNLKVDAAIHKANITVDEEGTEAAAATAIMVGVTSAQEPQPTIDVIIDRPFIFAIYDRGTSTLLFVGRVLNPAE